MRRFILGLLSLCIATTLTGCWDIKSLQDVNYFTGVGVDYVNDKYQIYVQQLDFSSVAKSEGGKSDTPATVWIGHAEGSSISEAIVELYQTAQQTVFWGHLNSIILSEKALQHGDLLGIFDSLVRSPEIRYTPWIYGSKKSIQELFTTKPFFNLSPLNSILHSPESNYRQRPVIAPMRLQQFIREIREPGHTVLLPSLSISDHTWTRNKKPDPKLEIDGVFAMHNTSLKSWMSYEELLGIRWHIKKTQASRLILKKNEEIIAAIKLAKPRSKIRINVTNGEPVFNIEIKVTAAINELWKPQTQKQMEEFASKKIVDQIKATHQVGSKRQADLLNLEHALYRQKFKLWQKLTANGRVPLQPVRLGEVKAEVRIVQSGVYKLRRKMTAF